MIGVVKRTTATTAYFRYMRLVPRMQASLRRAKFLSALPRPPAGPPANEKQQVLTRNEAEIANSSYPLVEARAAFHALEGRKTIGKVVLIPGQMS
jgi:hypothetical protein